MIMKKPVKKNPAEKSPTAILEQMLDCVPSPVFAKDKKHRFLYLNKAAADFLGHPSGEMLGKTDTDFFPAEQVRVFWEKDDKVFQSGTEDVNEENLTDAAGEKHTIITRKRVFRDGEGKDILVGIINDITAMRKAHSELSMFRKLLENSNDAIFIVDPRDGAFLDVNETACRRLGYPRETMLRMTVPDIEETAAGANGWSDLKGKVMTAENLLIAGRHRRADGSTFPVEVSVSKAEVDAKTYILANARDITERKKMEEAMREVDALRGLIPICAKCKKIRDDKGFWQKVETYLEKHSNARFTHGLCKDCMHELYGKESWFREEEK
jgi:PAS domain S-box-containing protein